MANQKTSAIQDAFTATSANAIWTVTQLGSATLSFASTGASVVFPATTSSSTDGDVTYASGQVLDMTGSFVRLSVRSVAGAGATHTDCVLRVRTAANNYVTIFYEAGTLFFSKVVAGSQTNINSVSYSATTHAWWQLRERGGTTYWETSSDGVSWTTQAAQANPITLTSVDILIGGICFGADTSPSNFTFRSLNYPLPGTTTSTSSTSISSTSTSVSSTSTSISSTSLSTSSTSVSYSTSSTSTSLSSTSSSVSSTSSSTSSTSTSSTSSSTSISSTSTSISSTSTSSTSLSSTSSSTSISSTSTSFSSTSSSMSSTSVSISSTSNSSTSSSSSTSTTTLPPPYLDYTYAAKASLPANAADVAGTFNAVQYSNVVGDDGDYFINSGPLYVLGQYKVRHNNNTDSPTFLWRGRSTVAATTNPILLQVFNQNSSAWETQVTNNSVRADTDFQMTASVTANIANYYDSKNNVTWRVYQQVV